MLLKYETVSKIGKGAYGVVWKAFDRKTNEKVAIKKVFDAFTNATDAQRTYREIFTIMELGPHTNVIQIMNLNRAMNKNDVYIMFELMESDLHTVIRAEICRDVQIRYIAWQILAAIKFIHSG